MPKLLGHSAQIKQQLESGVKSAKSNQTKKFITSTQMMDIGRPYLFRPEIDHTGAAKQFLEKKMGIVELIPCTWRYPVLSQDNNVSRAKPHIYFDDAISEYQNVCSQYGLSSSYSGLRLHLTDDTASTDEISNTYDDNIFQSAIDSLRTKFRHVQKLGLAGNIYKSTESNVGLNKEGSPQEADLKSETPGLIRAIGRNIILGSKLSFPRIWRDTQYNPNLNINVKLFSPYGHPDAIQKFIIEPLCHLIVLCSPRTTDGMAYGFPPTLHVKGYGMVHLTIACATSINWRRGGSDSNYSLYRQPTTVDVSLNLQSLIGGFGYYTKDRPDNESKLQDSMKSHEQKVQGNVGVSFPTLGHIIDSFRPFNFPN